MLPTAQISSPFDFYDPLKYCKEDSHNTSTTILFKTVFWKSQYQVCFCYVNCIWKHEYEKLQLAFNMEILFILRQVQDDEFWLPVEPCHGIFSHSVQWSYFRPASGWTRTSALERPQTY